MEKLRQLNTGFLSLLLLLLSTIAMGQIDITDQDAYYPIKYKSEFNSSNYLIVNANETKAINNNIPTKLFDVDVLATSNVTKLFDNQNRGYIVQNNVGNYSIKWFINNLNSSNYSLYNTGNNSYLYNNVIDLWILGHYVNFGFNSQFSDNNYYKWSININANVNNEITTSSIRSNYTSHNQQYFSFTQNDNNVTLATSAQNIKFYKQITLDFFESKTVNQNHIDNLPLVSETGGAITYQLLNHSSQMGNASNQILNNRITYTNIGTVDIIATVAAHNHIPSYKKKITVTIINPVATCFIEEFSNNPATNNTNFFPPNHNFEKISGSILFGNGNGKLRLDNNTKIRTKQLSNILGTVVVEFYVAGSTNRSNISPKIKIGFVNDNNQFLRPVHEQNINKVDYRSYTHGRFPNTMDVYEKYSYTFTNVPLNSRLYIESPGDNGDNNIFIEDIKIQCTPANKTYWEDQTWSDGVPTINNHAVIREDINTNVVARILEIEKGNVVVEAGNYFRVAEKLIINENASLTFEKGAYLLLDENVTVQGNASFRTGVDYYKFDTNMFSSPIENHVIKGEFTDNNVRVFDFSPSTNNWVSYSSNNFTLGKGLGLQRQNGNRYYSTNSSNVPSVFDGEFYGNPNNQNFQLNLSPVIPNRGYSLGNPYTVPLSITRFLNSNSSILNGLRIWKNENHWDSSVGAYLSSDYWINCNVLGCTNSLGVDKIDVGVGFVGIMSEQPTTTMVNFQHQQKSYDFNNTFVNERQIDDKLRYILNLEKDSKDVNSILIGYISGATDNYDNVYDFKLLENKANVLSILNNENEYLIEGRQYPYLIEDVVKLKLKVSETGNYKISLKEIDGNIGDISNLYLIDKHLDIHHDLLKDFEYSFTSDAGEFNDRFEIAFRNTSFLDLNEEGSMNKGLNIFKNGSDLFVKSDLIVNSYIIYDLSGRLIIENNKIDLFEFKINEVLKKGNYLISFKLNDGSIYNKIINK